MADFKVTTKDDYWISPNAVSITLNALGDCDRIQCSVASGANILCYVRGVDGLEFDVGHHYKYWPLSISPTYFDSHTEKYIYVAIPRSDEYGTQAMFVFPSELLDIYGKNAAGTQVGSVNHYYIFVQGIVSSSGYDGLTPRTWTQHPDWGWLDSAEAYSSGGDGTWWFYNAATDMVTFLKKIAYAAFEYLRSDMVDTVSLNVSGRSDLNDVHIKGSTYGDHFQSSEYTGDGMFDSGFMLRYADGHAKMVIDDLVCRGKFTINEIEDRIWTYSGGNLIFSAAGSTIRYVEYLDANGTPLGYTYINSRWLLRGIRLLAQRFPWARKKLIQRTLTPEERAQVVAFRCYETSDNGTMQTRNWWHIDDIAYCQTLNRVKDKTVRSGEYSGALSNTVYARRVVNLGSKRIEYSDDDFIYDYVDLSRTDCDPAYDDWPIAGDVIVQRGNFTDTSRQGLTTIEVTGDQRGVKVYDNFNNYDKSGKQKAFLGYDANLKRGLLEVYGDAYIGAMGGQGEDPHDGSTYIRYNSVTKLLEIKAKISASSTIGDKDVDEYVEDVMAPTITNLENADDENAKAASQADKDAYNAQQLALYYETSNARVIKPYFDGMASDGKITPDEKRSITRFVEGDDGQYEIVCAEAVKWNVDTTAMTAAYNAYKLALVKYTAATPEEITVESDYQNLYGFYSAYATLRQQIATAAKAVADNALSIANTANGKADAMTYLKVALGQKTDIEGGLVLTSLIALRDGDGTVWSGINGVFNSELRGNGIAAWYGGGMVDHEAYPAAVSFAKTLFRMDGTGYMAGGKITWNADGSGSVAGGNVSWDASGNVTIAGQSVSTTSLTLDGNSVNVQQLMALLDMFTREGDGTTASPYVIKANYSLYTEQSLSALGRGSGGSGGGGAQELNDLLDVIISNPRQNQVIKFDGTHFINADAPSGGIDMADVWAALAAGTNEQINASHLINIQPGTDMATVWAALAAATNEQIDAAHLTNALAAYATQTWVGQQGYITSGSLAGYMPLMGFNYASASLPGWGLLQSAYGYSAVAELGAAPDTNARMAFAYKGGGGDHQLSMQIDGFFYQNEGRYTLVDENSIRSLGAGYIEGTNAAASPGGALLRSGAGRQDTSPDGDTWIYWDTLGGTSSFWGIRHSQGPNRIDFCGHGDVTSYIDLNTGGIVCNGLTSNYNIGAGSNITAGGSISASGNVSAGNGITGTYVYASSYVSTASDARKKNVLGNIELTVEQIAAMPAVRFTWKDKNKPGVFVGTLAQSWQGPLPEAVHEQEDGTLSFDYSNAALVSVTVVARRVMDQERVIREQDRVIRQQEQEIRDLRCEVNNLKREMAELKAMLNLAIGHHGKQ